MGALHADNRVDRARVGEKAFNLKALMSMGFRVPPTFVIHRDSDLAKADDLRAWLTHAVGNTRDWHLAVRSSSTAEDTERESKAGHFLTELGHFDLPSLLDAIRRVQRSGPEMAVVVQPIVEACWSGVLFSCDPLTFERASPLIAWTKGLGDGLVSGERAAQHLRPTPDGSVLEGDWPSTADCLNDLIGLGTAWELANGGPADIEWAIDEQHRLWALQARPVVLPRADLVPLAGADSFARLPSIVAAHHKIRLRKTAAELGVVMAPAVVETRHGNPDEAYVDETPALGRAAAASVVLLHPERVNNGVVREFSPVRGSDVEFWTRGCRRYAIRRYPSVAGAGPAKRSVLNAGLAVSWMATAIVQAVWDAFATGIIRRTAAGYIIDIAQGHFVPKGVVATSTILLDQDKHVLSSVWRDQATAYRFIDGFVVTETPPEEQLELDPAQLADIATTLDPLFDRYPSAALEFGLLSHPPGFRTYLIDVAEGDAESMPLDVDMINSGVISTGRCQGRIHHPAAAKKSVLDSHLHDRFETEAIGAGPVVVAADCASVDLLPYLSAPGVVGFVFEQGSMLAHLSVVLREKGIPAVAVDDPIAFAELTEGLIVDLDAASRGLAREDRVQAVVAAGSP